MEHTNIEKTYKLISVKDLKGVDKGTFNNFYKEYIGCITNEIQLCENQGMKIKFVQTEKGWYCNRILCTTEVTQITEDTNSKINVITQNSVYEFEKTILKSIPYQDESCIVELYLSQADDYCFGKAFYYSSDKTVYELEADIHLGMFHDSVLIQFATDTNLRGYVCRYFPRQIIQFYGDVFVEDNNETSLLIHNTGQQDLIVSFPIHPCMYTISAGNSKYIRGFKAKENIRKLSPRL